LWTQRRVTQIANTIWGSITALEREKIRFKVWKFCHRPPFWIWPEVKKISTRKRNVLSLCFYYLLILHSFSPRCIHCMQRRLVTRKLSVRPFFCPSVKRVSCDKTKETCALIVIPHERTFILVLDAKTVGRGDSFYLKFCLKVTPLERKRQFSIDIRS